MRIGTVGTNFIVSKFIEAARTVPGVEVAAVYSRNAQTGAGFSAKHGVEKSYADWDAFLRNDALDFIYVASPNALHYPQCRDALLAGRGVICEKPFVSVQRELAELVKIARQRRLFLFEAMNIPHLPNFRLLQEHLKEIGVPRMAQLNFSQYSSRYDAFLRGEVPNTFHPAFSGGALMDLNYYNLNLVFRLWGEPDELTYFPNLAQNGIDTSGTLVLRYPGHIAVCTACKDSASRNFVQIQGEKGYILALAPSSHLTGGFTVYAGGEERHYDAQSGPHHAHEIRYFSEVFQAGDPAACLPPLEESLLAARLTEKARKDARIFFAADTENL